MNKTSSSKAKTLKKTELAVALSMLFAGQALAACPEQLTAGQDYTATTNCTSISYAIQAKNVAAGTVTINSGVTIAGSGIVARDNGGVVLGTQFSPTAASSLVALVNNGTILGGTTTTGAAINMWGDGFATQIGSITNNGLISGNVGVLTVNGATIGSLTESPLVS